jgi:outer membrane protein assembly factor BamD
MRKWFALAVLVLAAGCGRNLPVADSSLVERDRDLYESAMKLLDKSRFTAARLQLQTLMGTYPDSEFAPQAKYAVAESFYRESGHGNLISAEAEFRNFITFFPINELADDAQLFVAMTHIKQLQKPDRDNTEARLAEYELNAMIANYPDSPLLDEAKEKLRAVQEILAESILGPARQYYLRRAYAAVVDRCEEILKKYPDFSGTDRVLFMLAESLRKSNVNDQATIYYAQLVRDYPMSELVDDSTKQLKLLQAPVPEPNPVALARAQESKALTEGKGILSKFGFGLLFGGGSGVSTETQAKSIRDVGGQLSIEGQ